MRLIEIRLPSGHVYNEQERAWLKAAWVWGQEFVFDDTGAIEYTWNTFLVDADRMPVVPYEIKKVVTNDRPLGLDVDTAARVPPLNQRVNVTVPGLGLLLLNEVKVCTDFCTDELNEWLRSGWRIVAVCPQPDQRRPDYVLGRVKPNDFQP